jgi:hypothetical protein
MSVRTIASLTIFCLSTWLATSAQPAKEANRNTAHGERSVGVSRHPSLSGNRIEHRLRRAVP